ncbi:MAG: hypothetical protein Q9P14_14300, partial [candidate division KSB1 bacterium]|nr:hypothetical protein [candidate division KSB1 bacterium]
MAIFMLAESPLGGCEIQSGTGMLLIRQEIRLLLLLPLQIRFDRLLKFLDGVRAIAADPASSKMRP